jgi:hypothetical protein
MIGAGTALWPMLRVRALALRLPRPSRRESIVRTSDRHIEIFGLAQAA